MMGLHFDEVVIGRVDELGSYEFTREAMLAFARAYDPQLFHVNDEGAAKSHFGRLSASGWHTAAAWMRCYVETSQRIARERPPSDGPPAESGPSPGFAQLKWTKPVHAGDRVSYRTTVTDKREHAGRRDWGLVETFNEGHNQRGELVFSFNGKVLVKKR